MTLRSFWTWLHRYVGLAIAFFVIVAGLTGIPLAFYPELEAALNPTLYEPRSGPRLGPDELVRRVEAARPAIRVTGISWPAGPLGPPQMFVEGRPDPVTGRKVDPPASELYIDPADGRVIGEREWGAVKMDRVHVMSFLYRLHYTLCLPGNIGNLIFGIAALLWTLDCFVGFYLTLPMPVKKRAQPLPLKDAARAWGSRWKPAWLIKRGASFTRLNVDLHRAGGLWLWGVLFVLALSSVSFNLSDQVFRPAVGLFGTLTPSGFDVVPEPKDADGAAPRPRISYAEAVAAGRAALPPGHPATQLGYLSYLANRHAYWVVLGPSDKRSGYLQFEYAQAFVDATTGRTLHLRTYANGSAADKFVDWQFPLHSGQVLGLPGRILIAVGGLVAVVLSLTGVIIWWKKLRARQAHARRAADAAANRAATSFPGPAST